MKRIALTLLLLAACLWRASGTDVQTNVIYGTVGDYGLADQTNVDVTLTLVSPNPRTVNGVFVRRDPIMHNTGTSNYFAFTNQQWGKYTLTLSGERQGSPFTLFINTNTLGSVLASSLHVLSVTNLPPNPASNYYTMSQVDAMIYAATNGLSAGSGTSATNWFIAKTNLDPALGPVTNYAANTIFVSTNVTARTDYNTGTNAIIAAMQAGDAARVVTNNGTAWNLTAATNFTVGIGSNALAFDTKPSLGYGTALLPNGQAFLTWATNGAGLYAPDPGGGGYARSLISHWNYDDGTANTNRILIGDAAQWNSFPGTSNLFAGPLYGNGSGLTNTGVTEVSNQVNDIKPYVYKDVTNYSVTYSTDTNILNVTLGPFTPVSAGYFSNFTVLAGFGYSNNAPTGQRRSMTIDPGTGKGILSLNTAQTLWATNQYLGYIGRYFVTNGHYYDVTPLKTLVTNLALTIVNRLRVFNVDDYGGRGDGTPIYQYTLTNCVVTAPGAQFTSNHVGSLFYGFTDTNNAVPFVASISVVSNATTLLLDPSCQPLWVGTNREAVVGYNNSPAKSNTFAALTSWGRGGIMHYSYGVYLHGNLEIGPALTNGAFFNIPEPLAVNRLSPDATNFAVQTVIEGESEPVIFSQFIKNDSATVGRAWGGTIIYAAGLPFSTSDAIFRSDRHLFNITLPDAKAYDDFAWNNVTLRNLTVRQKVLPDFHGYWAEWGGMPHIENVTFDTHWPTNFVDVNFIQRVYPANGITNWISGFTNRWFTNLNTYCNVSNLSGFKVGVRFPRAWNYNGALAQNLNVFGYGIGVWAGEHTETSLHCNFDYNTIGGVIENTDYAESQNRGSQSPWVAFRPMFFHNIYPLVVSTNGTRHSVSFTAPVFENQSGGYGTATVTDPLKLLGGTIRDAAGIDVFAVESTNLVWNSLNTGVHSYGGNILTNIGALGVSGGVVAGTFTGSGAGLTAIPQATNALQLGGNAAANFLTNNSSGVTLPNANLATANLTGIPVATNLSGLSGTVPDAVLTNTYLGQFAMISAQGSSATSGVNFTNNTTVSGFKSQLVLAGFGVNTNAGTITNLQAGIFRIRYIAGLSISGTAWGETAQGICSNGVYYGVKNGAFINAYRGSVIIEDETPLPANTVISITNISLNTSPSTNVAAKFSVERLQ